MKKVTILILLNCLCLTIFSNEKTRVFICEFPDSYVFQDKKNEKAELATQLISDKNNIQLYLIKYIKQSEKINLSNDDLKLNKELFGVDSFNITFIFESPEDSKNHYRYFIFGQELDPQTPQNYIAIPDEELGGIAKDIAIKKLNQKLLSDNEVSQINEAAEALGIVIAITIEKINDVLLSR